MTTVVPRKLFGALLPPLGRMGKGVLGMGMPMEYKRQALETVRALKEAEVNPERRRDQYTGDMYCIHGTNVGNPYGADLMCGFCEDGRSHYEVALGAAHLAWRRDREAFKRGLVSAVVDFYVKFATEEGPAFTSGELADVYGAIGALGSE